MISKKLVVSYSSLLDIGVYKKQTAHRTLANRSHTERKAKRRALVRGRSLGYSSSFNPVVMICVRIFASRWEFSRSWQR